MSILGSTTRRKEGKSEEKSQRSIAKWILKEASIVLAIGRSFGKGSAMN